MKIIKPYLKKSLVWAIIAVLFLIPFIINCTYMIGSPTGKPNTAFSASDMLIFYGALLTFIGTVWLGTVALLQTIKVSKLTEEANIISKKLLDIENEKQIPTIDLIGYKLISRGIERSMKMIISTTKKIEGILIIKNISNIYINQINIESMNVAYGDEFSMSLTEIELDEILYYSNILAPYEEKKLSITLPLNEDNQFNAVEKNKNLSIKITLMIKTITNRTFQEHLHFQYIYRTEPEISSEISMIDIHVEEKIVLISE